MSKQILLAVLLIFTVKLSAQEAQMESYSNSAETLLKTDGKLKIGGYAEIHLNQELNSDIRNNAKLDVHRMVLLVGYQFSDKTQFISEIEYEHISEVFIEQAFIQHKLNKYMNFRAGLLLVPMGIINEYHEPTTFNAVERPMIDKYLSPTTWREIGIGFSGTILPVSLKYQAYLINGVKSFDNDAFLNGKDGFRPGRQKGAKSIMSSPNFTAKIEYFGLRGLNLGISTYLGKTQSTLYDGLDRNDNAMISMADSSVVGLNMIGLDARYSIVGWQFRGQYYYTSISNTEAYNEFTRTEVAIFNDLGSAMSGYYIEAAYNVLALSSKSKKELYPFIRYEKMDMHKSVSGNIVRNEAYNKTIYTTGLSYKLEKSVVLKADMQFLKSAVDIDYTKIVNLGFGVMF